MIRQCASHKPAVDIMDGGNGRGRAGAGGVDPPEQHHPHPRRRLTVREPDQLIQPVAGAGGVEQEMRIGRAGRGQQRHRAINVAANVVHARAEQPRGMVHGTSPRGRPADQQQVNRLGYGRGCRHSSFGST
jgi:hypothetical protein